MSTFPNITTESSKALKYWLASKGLDLHSFKAETWIRIHLESIQISEIKVYICSNFFTATFKKTFL